MYCTINDIVADIGEKTLISVSYDTNNASSVNEKLVENYINDVSDYIDSYISSVFNLPITNPKDLAILKRICVAIVVCDLYQRRTNLDYSESLSERRKKADDELIKIQKGIISFNSSKLAVDNGSRHYKYSKKTRHFSEETLKDY